MTSEQAIIDARDLHTYYGASHVLRGISFAVHAGEAIGLMGRNGMGKTTLIRTLVGLVRPRRGQIRVHGPYFLISCPTNLPAGEIQ